MPHIIGLLGPIGHEVGEAKRRVLRSVLGRLPRGATIVEVGTMRSRDDTADGLSTLVFWDWCTHNSGVLYSVDRNPDARRLAASVLGQSPWLRLVTADGAEFLRSFHQPIHLLYLDGSDSPEEALAQLLACEEHLRGLVLVDDTMDYKGHPQGKGTLVLPHLEGKGWRLTHYPVPGGSRMTLCEC